MPNFEINLSDLRIIKTPDYVELKTGGITFYKKVFGTQDGDCYKGTKRLLAQVWNYRGDVGLALSPSEEGQFIYGTLLHEIFYNTIIPSPLSAKRDNSRQLAGGN